MTEPCTECGQGWFTVYKSRRTSDGAWQTQYRRCWNCHHKPAATVVRAGPPKRKRDTTHGTEPRESISTTTLSDGTMKP